MLNQQITKSESGFAGRGNQIHELFAYLCVNNAKEAIEFYAKAFGARENFRLTEPSGRIGHAELDFGGATVMRFGTHILSAPEEEAVVARRDRFASG